MANKFLDQDGLLYLWSKIKAAFVAKETGKGLSTNDYTTAEKDKLASIAEGAQVNVQSDWSATSGDALIKNKPTIPTKTSELNNDSGFITSTDIPEGAAASTTAPKMDGTAAVGTEMAFARGDHVHPTDTSRVPVTRTVNGKALNADISLDADDVGARPNTWLPTASEVGARPNTWTPTASDVGAVPTSRTVNGKALSSNVTLSADDVGARADTWTPTADEVGARPDTWTPTASEVGAVPTSRTVNGKALSGNIDLSAADVSAIPTSAKGAAGGVASLDSDGKVPSTQLPSYVDDIVEGYYSGGKFYKEAAHTTEITGETGKIYVDLDTNLSYRYGGSAYVQITSSDMTKITNAEIDTIVAS